MIGRLRRFAGSNPGQDLFKNLHWLELSEGQVLQRSTIKIWRNRSKTPGNFFTWGIPLERQL